MISILPKDSYNCINCVFSIYYYEKSTNISINKQYSVCLFSRLNLSYKEEDITMSFKSMREFARGMIDENVYQSQTEAENAFELTDEEMNEAVRIAMPMYVQSKMLEDESIDECVSETYARLMNYLEGQGIITEASISISNPKINVVHLNKDAQIKRLSKIFTLKMARKANSKYYKKYKLGIQIKKTNMDAMVRQFGQKADRMAKQAWQQLSRQPKVNAVISDKKKSRKK